MDLRRKRGQSPAMAKAQEYMERGYTPQLAAKKAGVQVNSIYRRQWYKDLVAAKCAKA